MWKLGRKIMWFDAELTAQKLTLPSLPTGAESKSLLYVHKSITMLNISSRLIGVYIARLITSNLGWISYEHTTTILWIYDLPGVKQSDCLG